MSGSVTAERAVVLGGGSWGTALALLLARKDRSVTLWLRDRVAAKLLEAERENARYLPGFPFPDNLQVSCELATAVAPADLVVGSIPSSATPSVAAAAAPHLRPEAVWMSATKGLEKGTHRRMSEVVAAACPGLRGVAVLSGPSFAQEVAEEQPTAVVVACSELAVARELQALMSDESFRAYATDDVAGVEMGGAVKNVIAIATGFLEGLGMGHDPKAALITRGLHEIVRLSVARGAKPETLAGLAGMGDLVLTCTGGLSRNRRLGEAMGKGATVEEAAAELGQVAEGVGTTERVVELAAELGIEVPITEAVHSVLTGRVQPAEAIAMLMGRNLKDELE